jgi:hypothetical protein
MRFKNFSYSYWHSAHSKRVSCSWEIRVTSKPPCRMNKEPREPGFDVPQQSLLELHNTPMDPNHISLCSFNSVHWFDADIADGLLSKTGGCRDRIDLQKILISTPNNTCAEWRMSYMQLLVCSSRSSLYLASLWWHVRLKRPRGFEKSPNDGFVCSVRIGIFGIWNSKWQPIYVLHWRQLPHVYWRAGTSRRWHHEVDPPLPTTFIYLFNRLFLISYPNPVQHSKPHHILWITQNIWFCLIINATVQNFADYG